MGLFGKNDDKQRDNEALAAEVMRLDALPYEALAAEVLQRAFGADGPGASAGLQSYEIIAAINPSTRIFGLDAEAENALSDLVHEAIHVLYRAGPRPLELQRRRPRLDDLGAEPGRRARDGAGHRRRGARGCRPKVP